VESGYFKREANLMTQKILRIVVAEGGKGEISQSLRTAFPDGEARLDLTVVSSMLTLLPTLKVVAPEILLFDVSLAQPDVLETVRRLHRSAPGVPLIVIAEAAERELAMQCLQEGAMDFLLKGFMDQLKIESVLRAALESNTLRGLADLLRDPLTGLYIQEGFQTLGSRRMELARQNGGTMVIVCVLLENYQSIRTESGRVAADEALCDVADLLLGSFRRSDVVTRMGEAQFAAIAVDAAEPSSAVLQQRVERRLAVTNAARDGEQSLAIRTRAGFWSAADPRSFAEFLDDVESELRREPAQPDTAQVPQSAVMHR
jgi:diguanylate cyclase (GGDEF)-like protein